MLYIPRVLAAASAGIDKKTLLQYNPEILREYVYVPKKGSYDFRLPVNHNENFDSLEESRQNILDENAVDNMVVIRISEYLEGIEQRLNKIESKLGI